MVSWSDNNRAGVRLYIMAIIEHCTDDAQNIEPMQHEKRSRENSQRQQLPGKVSGIAMTPLITRHIHNKINVPFRILIHHFDDFWNRV